MLKLYTTVLSKYFVPLITVLSFIALLVGSGLRLHSQQGRTDTQNLFIPTDATAKYEYQTIQEHWPITAKRYTFGRTASGRQASYAIFRYKDGSSLMNLHIIAILERWNRKLIDEVYGLDRRRRRYYFKDICLKWFQKCSFTNQHLNILKYVLERDGKPNITFPKWRVLSQGVPQYIGTLLGGVQLHNGTNTVKSFNSLLMIYLLDYLSPELNDARFSWEKQFVKLVQENFVHNESSPFDVTYYHSKSIQYGINEVPAVAASRIVYAIIALVAFAVINFFYASVRHNCIHIIWSRSKPILGVVGIITATYGIITAIGLHFYLAGERIGMLTVVPFLTMSIGLDDTFIALTAWHQTERNIPVSSRLCKAIAGSMPSITITSLTNFISFIIGLISPLPAIKIFSKVTAMAIFFNYVYQILFFPAMMYVSGVYEAEGMQRCFYFLKLSYRRDVDIRQTVKKDEHIVAVAPNQKDDYILVRLMSNYCRYILHNTVVKTVTLFIYTAYVITSIYGITIIKQGLPPDLLVLNDHHMAKFGRSYWSNFFTQGQQAEIVINNAPNLTFAFERQKMHYLVKSIEGTTYTMSDEATDFFLRGYEEYLESNSLKMDNTAKIWQAGLYSWSTMNIYRRSVEPDMVWRNATGQEAQACRECDRVLKAFRLRIGMRDIALTKNQRRVAKYLRSLSDKYPEYNITTYYTEWPLVDQYNIVVPNTLITVSTGMVSMAVVAAIFFRDALCLSWTVLSIMSINIGVVGYMSLWRLRLECASMVGIIMSIGLSIDYTAHVIHGFRVALGSIDDRISTSLVSLGTPILQGGLSTLVGISAIGTLDAYLFQVFFKIVVLAVCIGLLHACLFIPVGLSTAATLFAKTGRKAEKCRQTVLRY